MRNISAENTLERGERGKKFGVTVGIVTSNKDPDSNYKVRCRIPSQANGDQSGANSEQTHWYRVCTFGAGTDRGMFNLPEVDDEVLIAFENGEVSHGFIIGTLWNKSSKAIGNNSDGKNNLRWYKSRSGSILQFSDEDSKTNILIKTSGGHQIMMDDTSPGKIVVQHSTGNTKMTLKDQDIEVESTGDTMFKCKNFKVTANANIELTSTSDTKITASANIKGQASANIELNASAEGKFTSSGTMTIKGAMVNIN